MCNHIILKTAFLGIFEKKMKIFDLTFIYKNGGGCWDKTFIIGIGSSKYCIGYGI